MDPSVLARKQLTELKAIASHLNMRGYQRLKKAELIDAIVRTADSPGAGRSSGGVAVASAEGASDAGHNGGGVAVAERPEAADTAPASDGQLRLTSDRSQSDANGSHDSSDEARSRVRTRSRERNGEPQQTETAETAPAPAAAVEAPESPGAGETSGPTPGSRAREGRPPRDRDRGERPERPATTGTQGNGAQPDATGTVTSQPSRTEEGDAEEAGNRRRRSRRERRRNKQQGGQGGQGQGGQGQGGQGQGGQGQQGHSQVGPGRNYREDESTSEPGEVRSGVLDILPEGYGFLRTSGYLPGDRDVYVSQSQIRRHGLRRGDVLEGPIRQQRPTEKVPALHQVDVVNGAKPDEQGNLPHRPEFKDMTPLFPDERLRLETPEGPISMRIMDLMSPIGKGQRGLIVSPPKAGKTTILKELGQAIAFNNPECHVMVVLVDERPEEVTDMQRSVPGEIIASTFDRPADDHTQIAELAMERAKRLVEAGRDVVVLLDSITRLARAYNLAAPASGRIMSGGVDSTALYPPKRFFGAARNIEHGGSLTIIASALIETGSKMDEVIFEEFKGTGNCEIRLDRKLEQKRVFPAIDIEASGTRKEELILDREELAIIWKLRRVLNALEGPASVELLIDKMKQTRSNNQFLLAIQKSNMSAA
jgi:transcription termination factor Rho